MYCIVIIAESEPRNDPVYPFAVEQENPENQRDSRRVTRVGGKRPSSLLLCLSSGGIVFYRSVPRPPWELLMCVPSVRIREGYINVCLDGTELRLHSTHWRPELGGIFALALTLLLDDAGKSIQYPPLVNGPHTICRSMPQRGDVNLSIPTDNTSRHGTLHSHDESTEEEREKEI